MSNALKVLVVDDSATVRQVFGMPREAILLGAVDEILPLHRMAQGILRHVGLQKG